MGKRKRRCGTSADELGAAGKVAAEPGGGDAVPTQLVQQQMVDTVKCLAQVDRRQRRSSATSATFILNISGCQNVTITNQH